ncbi:MAG: LuxR C-terminal-related transcriptional regulator [Oscillospiraceae bacterium]|jgi:DNA-binding NarL/FixJ family response regulator|nr:LuxR C-terminal-related transcriptional regulator [Oscillospiraceae bacterium]
MNHSLLIENESKRLNIRLPLLICFAMFTAWQIGVFSYSGEALAVTGRLPFGVDAGNFTPLISLGYLVSIAYMLALPRRIVQAERVIASAALLSALALNLPLSHETRTRVERAQLFCCSVLVGCETALIVGLFSERTAVKHLLVAYGLIFAIAGLMQNQFFDVPYRVFQYFNVAAIVLQLVFYLKLPANVWPRYAEKDTAPALTYPKKLFAGLLILCFLGNILISFGLSVAESVPHGVFVFDCAFALSAVVGYALFRRAGLPPLRFVSVTVLVSVVGFILAMVALYVPKLTLFACALLGPGTAANILIPYYGVVMSKRYPSRFIAPVMIGISFAASVLLLSWLIEAFRENEILLYTLYIAIAVIMAVVFLMLEPYLLYSFRGRSALADLLETRKPEAEDNETKRRETAPAGNADSFPEAPQNIHISESAQRVALRSVEKLTHKELEIMELMLQGFTAGDIARQTVNAVRTINTHQSRIYAKLQIHKISELFALERQLREEQGKTNALL